MCLCTIYIYTIIPMHAHTYSMTMASVKVNIEKHAFQLFGRMWDVWGARLEYVANRGRKGEQERQGRKSGLLVPTSSCCRPCPYQSVAVVQPG